MKKSGVCRVPSSQRYAGFYFQKISKQNILLIIIRLSGFIRVNLYLASTLYNLEESA